MKRGKHLRIIMLGLAAGLLLAACQTGPTVLPDDEADAFAADVDEIVTNMITGLSDGDFAQHVRDFDEEMSGQVDTVTFQQIYDEVIGVTGPYVSHSLNRVEDEGRFRSVVYDVVFEDDPAVTMRVVFWKDDASSQITGLWFDSEMLRAAQE